MTRYPIILFALLTTATFAITLSKSLLDEDDIRHPSRQVKPIHTPCNTHSLVTAIPIPILKAKPQSSAAPVVDPLPTAEPSFGLVDSFATPEPSFAPIDKVVTPEHSASAVDPTVSPESNNAPNHPMPFSDAQLTPEPSLGFVNPMVTPAPSASALSTQGRIHTKPSPHPKVVHPAPPARVVHPPHTTRKTCFVQNVNFVKGTAERCCEERFSCVSPECAHAHACSNPDVCFCRKRVCRKVFIKFSYTNKVDQACSKHLFNHF